MAILRIPSIFYSRFNNDPYESCRNILSIPLGALSPFFNKFDAVLKAMSIEYNPFNPSTMIFDPAFVCRDSSPRYMHIDLGLKFNACGISMAHVEGFNRVVEEEDNIISEKYLPNIVYDFIGKIFPPTGGEVFIADIRDSIIYELTSRGFNLRLITFDSFASTESIQVLKRQGYTVDNLSLDRTTAQIVVDYNKPDNVNRVSTKGNYMAAWEAFKTAIYENRVKMPYNDDFINEARHAERRISGNRVSIDCQSNELTLDLMESMAGTAFNVINNEVYYEDLTNLETDEVDEFYSQFGNDRNLDLFSSTNTNEFIGGDNNEF